MDGSDTSDKDREALRANLEHAAELYGDAHERLIEAKAGSDRLAIAEATGTEAHRWAQLLEAALEFSGRAGRS